MADKATERLRRRQRQAARRALLGARSAVGQRGGVLRVESRTATVRGAARTSRPEVAPPTPFRRRRIHAFIGRVGRVPLALGSLLVGALIPWAVNAYAPAAVEKVTTVPAVEVTGGLDAAGTAPGWTMAVAPELFPSNVPKTVHSCDELRRWLMEEEAYEVETTWLRVFFRGTRLTPVTVTDIRVVIDEKAPALTGTDFACPSAGSSESEEVGVNLDETNPVLRTLEEENSLAGPWFRENFLTLERNEVITFAVKAFAYKASYKWHLEATVRASGEEVSVPIPGSYRTTAARSYGQSWSWDWTKKPQRLVPRSEGP